MPRRPSIHLDGVPLHLVQRGHNREPCFFVDEQDQQVFLKVFGLALTCMDAAGEWRLHAALQSPARVS